MKICTITRTIAATLVILSTGHPALAYKIGGNVTQSAQVSNAITAAIGDDVYARTNINAVQDGADIGGNVTQTLRADNVITGAVGHKATACTSINVLGERDCSRR